MKVLHAALLAVTTLIFASAAQAAPLTGHDVRIIVREAGGGATQFDLTRTVLDGPVELTSADSSFFDTSSSLDIGPDFISVVSDGTGPSGLFDMEIHILTSDFVSFGNGFASDIGGTIQTLTELIIIEDFTWNTSGSLLVSSVSVTTSASVPAPGALALLGFGLIGLGARRRIA